jgi:hypothetical protein
MKVCVHPYLQNNKYRRLSRGRTHLQASVILTEREQMSFIIDQGRNI